MNEGEMQCAMKAMARTLKGQESYIIQLEKKCMELEKKIIALTLIDLTKHD